LAPHAGGDFLPRDREWHEEDLAIMAGNALSAEGDILDGERIFRGSRHAVLRWRFSKKRGFRRETEASVKSAGRKRAMAYS
jgi:hypothetical protein